MGIINNFINKSIKTIEREANKTGRKVMRENHKLGFIDDDTYNLYMNKGYFIHEKNKRVKRLNDFIKYGR